MHSTHWISFALIKDYDGARREIDQLPQNILETPEATTVEVLENNFRGSPVSSHLTHRTIANVLEKTIESDQDIDNVHAHREYADFFQQKSGIDIAGRDPAPAAQPASFVDRYLAPVIGSAWQR